MANSSTPPLLVLIGFMGVGKSTLGGLLAHELRCPLTDLDAEITRIHGTIPELFATRGESGFRAIEHHQLDQTLAALRRPAVLSLGGGAYIHPANRELLAQVQASVIFLDAPFEVLSQRIANSPHERPLAADPERLRKLYEQRRACYLLADHKVDASAPDPLQVLPKLLEIARGLGAASPARDTLRQRPPLSGERK